MLRKARWPAALVCLTLGLFGGYWAGAGSAVGNRLLADAAGVGPGVGGAAVPAIPSELTSYRDIVKKVLPAVVSIEARKARPDRGQGRAGRSDDFPGLPDEFRRFFEGEGARPQGKVSPQADATLGFGSGVIVDARGVVLTNYHVIDGADSVEVQLTDGRKFVSKNMVGDRKTDLAIVRLQPKADLPALELGNSDEMEVGDRVLAVGAPFGLAGSVTHGIVSAKSRNLHMNLYEDFLQTDAAINPGNSGGPLINLAGKVIGINSAIKSRSGGFQGVGMAISSNLAKSIMQQLVKDGVVKRGYLGVQIKDVDAETAARLGLKEAGGVLVSQVFDKSPAEKGGLKKGDVVTAVDGKSVADGRALQKIVAGLKMNQSAQVVVQRDGKPVTLKLTIAEQPDEFGTSK